MRSSQRTRENQEGLDGWKIRVDLTCFICLNSVTYDDVVISKIQ